MRESAGGGGALCQELEEVVEGDLGLERVAQVGRAHHLVAVAATDLRLAEISLADELADDLLYGAFGDPHSLRHVPHASIRVTRERHEHVSVVGQKRPLALTHPNETTRKIVRSEYAPGDAHPSLIFGLVL